MKNRSDKQVVQPRKKALLARLRRVEGQVKGIARMIEEDRYCVDVQTQLSAAKSALDAIALRLLEDHTLGCVRRAIRADERTGEAAVQELLMVVRKLSR